MRILCVHQSAELYGSDRSFLLCVGLIRAKFPNAFIAVVLPCSGPLVGLLSPLVDEVIFEDIVTLQRRDIKMLLLNKLFKLFFSLSKRVSRVRGFDLVYVNTVVILDYILALRFVSANAVIHVREIPTGLARKLFSAILKFSKASLVFNSAATASAFSENSEQTRYVVLNGIEGYGSVERAIASDAVLNLLVIGRINSWKGQQLLVEAVAQLKCDASCRVSVRIVGGTATGQDHYLTELQAAISASGLDGVVEYFPFSNSPAEHFAWADVVVVPSLKPEPFGLVAIEAMSAGCVVVAARHGGLIEIVEDGVDGYLFNPGDANDLSKLICTLSADRDHSRRVGERGRRKFIDQFSMQAFQKRFFSMMDAVNGSKK